MFIIEIIVSVLTWVTWKDRLAHWYSPVLISWFILNCPSVSPQLRTCLVQCIPPQKQVKSRFVKDREMRVPLFICPLLVKGDFMIYWHLFKIFKNCFSKKKDLQSYLWSIKTCIFPNKMLGLSDCCSFKNILMSIWMISWIIIMLDSVIVT